MARHGYGASNPHDRFKFETSLERQVRKRREYLDFKRRRAVTYRQEALAEAQAIAMASEERMIRERVSQSVVEAGVVQVHVAEGDAQPPPRRNWFHAMFGGLVRFGRRLFHI